MSTIRLYPAVVSKLGVCSDPERSPVREGGDVPVLDITDVPETEPSLGSGNHWFGERGVLVIGSSHIVGDSRWTDS